MRFSINYVACSVRLVAHISVATREGWFTRHTHSVAKARPYYTPAIQSDVSPPVRVAINRTRSLGRVPTAVLTTFSAITVPVCYSVLLLSFLKTYAVVLYSCNAAPAS
jgi:hypothetical protein